MWSLEGYQRQHWHESLQQLMVRCAMPIEHRLLICGVNSVYVQYA